MLMEVNSVPDTKQSSVGARELIRRTASVNQQLSPEAVQSVIEAYINQISLALVEGSNVKIRYFGTFELTTKAARLCNNFGSPVKMPARSGIKFNPSRQLQYSIVDEAPQCVS